MKKLSALSLLVLSVLSFFLSFQHSKAMTEDDPPQRDGRSCTPGNRPGEHVRQAKALLLHKALVGRRADTPTPKVGGTRFPIIRSAIGHRPKASAKKPTDRSTPTVPQLNKAGTGAGASSASIQHISTARSVPSKPSAKKESGTMTSRDPKHREAGAGASPASKYLTSCTHEFDTRSERTARAKKTRRKPGTEREPIKIPSPKSHHSPDGADSAGTQETSQRQ